MSGGRGTILLASSPTASPSTNTQSAAAPGVSYELSAQSAVGQAMVRTGVAILMVPDPLPLVDEVVGGALVVGGAILTMAA